MFNTSIFNINSNYQETGQYSHVFKHFDEHGLISYYDYIFLLAVLSKNDKNFNIAFNLLDYNDDGVIDLNEYTTLNKYMTKIDESILQNDVINDNTINETEIPNLLKSLFFDINGQSHLSFKAFEAFAHALHFEIWFEEFLILVQEDFKDNNLTLPDNPQAENFNISAKLFTQAILRNTQLPSNQIDIKLETVEEKFKDTTISFDEFVNFNKLLLSLDDFVQIVNFLEQSNQEIGLMLLLKRLKCPQMWIFLILLVKFCLFCLILTMTVAVLEKKFLIYFRVD